MDGLFDGVKIQLPQELRSLCVWESTAILLEDMAASRAKAIAAIDHAKSSIDMGLVSPAEERAPVRNIKKTDLIRLSINLITEDRHSFTFFDIYTCMQGCIDKQTVSALVNRLYATGELISGTRTADGCLNYVVKSLRSIPSWIDSMSMDEAVETFKSRAQERWQSEQGNPSTQIELTCGNHTIEYLNHGFDRMLSAPHQVQRYVTAMD